MKKIEMYVLLYQEGSPFSPSWGNASVFCFDFDVFRRDDCGNAGEDREDGRKHVEAVLVEDILKTKKM
jgi:hypothetical protein